MSTWMSSDSAYLKILTPTILLLCLIEFWFDQVYLLCAYCFSDSPQHHRENRFPKMFRHRIEHHAKLDKQVRTFE